MAKLNVSRIKNCSLVLGPGKRAVIWFCGCSKNCPGCIAKSNINHDDGFTRFSAIELCRRVTQISLPLEGITLSGGEPFEQDLAELGEFLRLVKTARRNWSIMCYSGRYLSELKCLPGADKVLNQLDLLVDGPYMERLNCAQMWRGSGNQNLIAISERYKNSVDQWMMQKSRTLEMELDSNLNFSVTGIPEAGFMDNLKKKLSSQGLDLQINCGESGS